jgi:hypothetical protein
MIKFLYAFVLVAFAVAHASAQKIIRETPTPAPTPAVVAKKAAPASVPLKTVPEKGVVIGNSYTNRSYGFEIVFPNTWTIAGDDFGDYVKTQGFDLSLKAPAVASGVNLVKLDSALRNVTVLLTAVRSGGSGTDNAILRISTEELYSVPQVKDAVDYFDLMRSQFAAMSLPADFKYSETQAEKLGRKQFAFLDTSTTSGKKRLYATVKGRHAIMFTLTYRTDEDLKTMREILASGDFYIK